MARHDENQLTLSSSAGFASSSAATMHSQSGDEDRGANLWAVVDDRLRGRWRQALLCGAVLSVIMAPIGYFATGPIYESTGLIRVAPKLDHVLHETQETELMPLYSQFVATQAQLISSQRVLEAALKDPSMSALEWSRDPGAIVRMSHRLDVASPRNSQLVAVTYEGDSAREAEVAVNAVLRAYHAVASESGGTTVSSKLQTLQERRTKLTRDLYDIRKSIEALPSVSRFGTADLDALLRMKIEQLERMDQEIDWIAVAQSTDATAEDGEESAATLSDAQLEMLDPHLKTLRETCDRLQLEFEQMRRRFAPAHRRYQEIERDLAAAQEILTERRAAVHDAFVEGRIALPGLGNDALSTEQLVAKRATLTSLREELAREVQMIGADSSRVAEYHDQQQQIRRDLIEVEARLVDLQVESDDSERARISVYQWGMRPVQPAKDRRKALAAVGAAGGFGASLLAFFLLGTLDRRAFRVEQITAAGGLRNLGVLPDLGRSLGSPEAAETAVHCVHQIRNLIEAVRPPRDSFVLAVTSPFQGDGKTSIAIALGLSYAAAGNRTIVVDADLVGRGLTRQLGLVGETGLRESLRSPDADINIMPIHLGNNENLFALPVGIDHTIGSEGVRRQDIERLYETLRESFDTILVDTGPVLGSLECIPVSAAADGVVLTLRRGRQRSRLQECVAHLSSVGARCLGLVLNCAERRDCHRYVSEMSMCPPVDDEQPGGRQPQRDNLLVSAMQSPRIARDAA